MGKPHGTGRYEWSDGSYYEGDFEQGYREGKGELREKNGTYYKGNSLAKLVKALSRGISNTVLVNKL